MEALFNKIYKIDTSNKQQFLTKGFKPHRSTAPGEGEHIYYTYCFNVHKWLGYPVLECELVVNADGLVDITVYTNKGEIYAPFYGFQYGDYKPILEKIHKNILKEFKKLGIKEIKKRGRKRGLQ